LVILIVAIVAVAAAAAAAAGGYIAVRHNRNHRPTRSADGRSGVIPTTASLALVSSTPTSGARNVPSDQVVTLHLSLPLADDSGLPTFSPPMSGSWARVGSKSLSFHATAPFIPTSTETLHIPAGRSGLRGTGGQLLAAPVTVTFTVAQASTERLQQLLAELNYLPLSFTPAGPPASPVETTTAQPGTFAWRWPDTPPSLTSLWIEGYENVITKGAVMNFENQNDLTVDGLAGPEVWATLLNDVATKKVDTDAYTYVFVSKQLPEALTLFENGSPVIVNTPVNTGAPGADTVDGTYPVFEHVVSSRMQGTNPDGSTYDDPAVPWASFFNGGDALHGFVRATYGSPQSNGCVEMPVAVAAQVWPLSPIGTLVTVVGPAS
jgi:peptidoglycan hydrolase-like protein with peptidoglycan-binding domain